MINSSIFEKKVTLLEYIDVCIDTKRASRVVPTSFNKFTISVILFTNYIYFVYLFDFKKISVGIKKAVQTSENFR